MQQLKTLDAYMIIEAMYISFSKAGKRCPFGSRFVSCHMLQSTVALLACSNSKRRASCGVYPNKRPSNVSAITATSNKTATAFHSNGERAQEPERSAGLPVWASL